MIENKKPNRLVDFFNKLRDPNKRRYYRITYHVVWNILLLFIVLGLIGTAFAGGVGAGYFASLVKSEPIRSEESLSKDIYNYEEVSEIYFANNVYLGKLNTDLEREEISLEEMSDYLKNAVIATEDEYFYEHDGVVPKAILRALFQEVTASSVQSGGSTLTQQLIKQQVLTNEVSFDRKAKEILLALRIERFFEKDEILEAYLNISPFGRNSSGRNIAGVQAAAQGLFGVDAKDLNLAQSAYIAGLPQSPFRYTPFYRTAEGEIKIKTNLEPGLTRQKTVLSRMLDGEFITQEEYEDALAYDVTKDFASAQPSAYSQYPQVTTEIESRATEIIAKILAKEAGIDEKEYEENNKLQSKYKDLAKKSIIQNGYRIHSTINKEIYDKMQEVVDNFAYYGKTKKIEEYNPETKENEWIDMKVQVGASLIENSTGKIISFVGGRDFKNDVKSGEWNFATRALRSNGSTMKPLLVYAPGIELGALAPGSLVIDAPINVNGWKPGNYGQSYKGLMTARQALIKSDNVPAVKFYMDIINQNPVQYLEKMGFTSLHKEDFSNPSMSIGSLKNGVSVEENTNAYVTFANGGNFVDAYMIEKIETKDGEIIYQHEAKPTKVFSPQTAYLTLDMMRDVMTSGTGTTAKNRLKFRSDFAGKSGTGNNFYDASFVATNPSITFGIWNGYDKHSSLNDKSHGLSYSQRIQYLWAELLNAAYSIDPNLIAAPNKSFKSPGGLVSKSYCAALNLNAELCKQIGIGGADLYPSNFKMKLSDSTTAEGKFVLIGDKRYAALPNTPEEFTEKGQTLSQGFLELIGGKYISKDYIAKQLAGKISNSMELKENGAVPGPPQATLQGNTITWKAHTDTDIIGYRVYRNGQKVGTIKGNSSLSYNAQTGDYTITAVDIAGNESPHSNMIQAGVTEPEKPIEPEKPVEPPKIPEPGNEPKPNPGIVEPGPGPDPIDADE